MRSNTFQCDNCEKRRDQDSNHWYVLFAIPVSVRGDVASANAIGAVIAPWSEEVAARPEVTHACGQECGFALLARRLATGSFERAAVGARNGQGE